MKRFIVASAAVFALTACSEATAPAAADLSLAYGKKAPPPPPATTGGSLTNALFTFDAQTLAAASGGGGGVNEAAVRTDVVEGASVASSATPIPTYNVPTNYFVGRFENTQTVVALDVPHGGTKYALELDVYAIGSWDGRGQQAQSGAFLANLFQVGYTCPSAPGTVNDIFTTTFSNQMTVQQNYPNSAASGGGAKALSGSVASNSLFRGDPTVNVPLFKSVSDATYHLEYSGANPCGTGAVTFIFRTYATQQSAPDETWGVDNISIKTDN